MTDQEMRAAIADACGWRSCGCRNPQCVYARWGEGGWGDPLKDMNACHEMEKVLEENDGLLCTDYVNALQAIEPYVTKSHYGLVHAPARHRAEAFLRTIGKWKD